MNAVHGRIEAIAGAIALGEASDEERQEYRRHLAACEPCLREFGGECEIERVASTVTAARESEVWEPSLGDVVAKRMRARSRAVRWGASIVGFAAAASFGVHALLAASIGQIVIVPPQAASASDAGITRIVLEQSAPVPKALPPAPATPQPERHLIVTHNVVQIARAPLSAAAVQGSVPAPAATPAGKAPREIATMVVHPDAAASQSRRNASRPPAKSGDASWRTVAQTTTTSVIETAPESLTHSAESLQVASNNVREVAPLGGETAINPQPPMIAYDEGAEGTTLFEVHVDQRGIPTKCVVTKSAGYLVLDESVCRAAMKARYTPKTIGGRPVPGIYRDAFTFRVSDQTSDVQGVHQNIPVAGPQTLKPDLAPQETAPFARSPGGSF